MALTTYVYSGEAYHWHKPTPAEEGKINDAILKIRSLYHAGTPFYTKEALQGVCQQLEKSVERGQKVLVKGLDGVLVDFDIESGRTIAAGEPNLEFIMRAPLIFYLSIQELTSIAENYIPRIAFCNLRIYHNMDLRNKFSKELVGTLPTRSTEEAQEYFATMRNTWEASERCKQLRSIFISIKTLCGIRKIVGFGCAPMAYSCQEQNTRRAAFQHALILTLWDILGKKANPNQIRCFVQDPAYTEIDKSVLEGYGITVLDDPKGFLEVDDSAAVISCAPDVPVKQIISDLAQPAMMIWDAVSKDRSEVIRSNPDSPRLREMICNFYDEFEFPKDLEHFGNISIYVRRTVSRSPGVQGIRSQG